MLTQEWRGWLDPIGYEVEVWYRPSPDGLWGVNVVEYWDGNRWRNPALKFISVKNQVRVHDEWGRSWSFDLGEVAESYVDSGFLFDSEWQPKL